MHKIIKLFTKNPYKMTNNYTVNGNGKTSIELDCNYFGDNYDFSENFHSIKDDLLLYINFGNYNFNDFSKNDLWIIEKGKEEEARKFIFKETVGNFDKEVYKKELAKMNRTELKEELINELVDYFDLEDLGFTAKNPDFKTIESRGYSQGDYREIIIPEKALLEIWGSEKIDYENLKKELNNYLWDSPVCGTLAIDNDRIELCDILSSVYNLDVDDIKREILEYTKKKYNKKQNKDLKEFLDENFTEIEYL